MAFGPLYVLGIMGATRRLDHYDASTGWQPFFILALIGGVVIMFGVALQIVQIIASVIQKRHLVDTTGDPWDGRSLEWAVGSPPPFYNFTVIPHVTTRDAYWDMKNLHMPKRAYEDIHIPRNTGSGIYISAFAFLIGFGFVWEIIWLVVVSLVGIIICVIARTFNEDIEYTITAAEVEKLEDARNKKDQETREDMNKHTAEDMGLWEFIIIVIRWAFNVVKTKRWRTW